MTHEHFNMQYVDWLDDWLIDLLIGWLIEWLHKNYEGGMGQPGQVLLTAIGKLRRES